MGYYVFEGMNGTGKTTLSRMFTEHLRGLHGAENVVTTFEPGGTLLGAEIRATLLHTEMAISPEAQFMMMCADRAQNMFEIVIPTLEAGKHVVSDRSYMSSLVFQQDSNFSFEEILNLSKKIMQGHAPTWFTITSDRSLQQQVGYRDRYEKEQDAKMEEYLSRYLIATEALGGHVIDNSGKLETSFEQILRLI
jgi:dTMP kinase